MQMTAINWLLYKLTESPLQLGMNGLFRAIPAIGLGIYQRHVRGSLRSPETFAHDSMSVRIAALWCSACWIIRIALSPWHIYTFTFLSAAVGSCDGPARQALFPSLVPRALLPNAVALNSIIVERRGFARPLARRYRDQYGWERAGAFYANAATYLDVVMCAP